MPVPSASPSASPVGTNAEASPERPSDVPGTATSRAIERLAARLAEHPEDGQAYLDLGLAFLQRARETGDPGLYERAGAALERARELRPDDALVLVGLGTLELAKHDFASALRTGQAAIELDPGQAAAHGVVADALVELGRYEEAVDALQTMLDLQPDLAAWARVSYLRELYGDLEGAEEAMREAVRRAGPVAENRAYVTALLGNLLAYQGRRAEAASAYEQALTIFPDHGPSLLGLARLAIGDGDLGAARARLERAVEVLPLPEYVVALGEVEEAAGDRQAAKARYELAAVETKLFQAAGVTVDLELALFEADHGDRAQALELARAAYRERATIRTADALAWALQRMGQTNEARRLSAEALRLGTRDPLLLYHAGAIAADDGDQAEARRFLTDALAIDPGFSATGAAEARRLLEQLAP